MYLLSTYRCGIRILSAMVWSQGGKQTVQFADNEIARDVSSLKTSSFLCSYCSPCSLCPLCFLFCFVFCFLFTLFSHPLCPLLHFGHRVPQGMYTFRGNASCRLTLLLAGTFGTAFMIITEFIELCIQF